MLDLIRKYKDWKEANPDEDYQNDEINEFLANFSRGDLHGFLEEVEKMLDNAKI